MTLLRRRRYRGVVCVFTRADRFDSGIKKKGENR